VIEALFVLLLRESLFCVITICVQLHTNKMGWVLPGLEFEIGRTCTICPGDISTNEGSK
jgi:hypothetical protein